MQRNPQPATVHNSLILWEKWVLANTIAAILGLNIIAVINPGGSILGNSFLGNLNMDGFLLLAGVLGGVILGFAQWLALRRYIHNLIWWVLATTVGVLLGWLILLVVSIVMAFAYAYGMNEMNPATLFKGVAYLGGVVGAVLGFAQWLVLKAYVRCDISQAAWWMVANALAWSLGLLIAFVGTGIKKIDAFASHTALIELATGATMGAVIGGITGIALVWLLQPRLRQHY
ncbi:MAG: hypothetical protein ACHBN1_06290 [Heteroscytonema crispum UTEX LB 1556]